MLQHHRDLGASLLAEEMEQTCRHLTKIAHGTAQTDDGIEALSRAAVQLPAYVERIRNGGRDVPLVLLPLLNDLRAARGRPLLSESTLLLLNIGSGAVGGRGESPAAAAQPGSGAGTSRQLAWRSPPAALPAGAPRLDPRRRPGVDSLARL